MKEALITMITVPFALMGIFMVYFMGNLSVAVVAGLSHFWDDRNSYDNDYLLERMNKLNMAAVKIKSRESKKQCQHYLLQN
jgi:Cu(I)/Ag(I) efflux system membrane protein CusA/SilA